MFPTVGSRSVRTVPALLERGRTLCAPLLQEVVARLAPPLDAIGSYHFGWTDHDGTPVVRDNGKALRPALALLSAEAAGAGAEIGVPGGAAVELVHNYSLIHDDLMDGDETRRHRPTVWALYGTGEAVLAGDALAALATGLLLDTPHERCSVDAVRELTSAVRDLIDGQAQDLSFESRGRVSLRECQEMQGNKTGALLACASSIGAVLAGADGRTTDALRRFGHHLGLAFQAVDDLLGIWGATEVTGKPRWSDLRRHKKTLPITAALAEGGNASRRLADLLGRPVAPGDDAEGHFKMCADLVEEAGGRAWTEAEAHRRHEAAVAALDAVVMPSQIREEFEALARFVVVREK
ncbi:polyprenyl synthetase family protein [Streptomyces sp. NPDC055607]